MHSLRRGKRQQRLHIPNKPQRTDRAGIPGVPADSEIGEQGKEVKVGMEFDRGT